MTLIVAWTGFDDKSRHRRKVSSLYIAADSRISWNGDPRYDGHQKVFASIRYPEIFGFCGDVTFCNMAISQILTKIDRDILFSTDEPNKASIIGDDIRQMQQRNTNMNLESSQIIYGTRIAKQFHLYLFRFQDGDVVMSEWPISEERHREIFSGGSGQEAFKDNFMKIDNEKNENHNTTRNVYHCVAQTIEQCSDPKVGGVPQMVGLYCIGNGRQFGIAKDGDCYFGGQPCKDVTLLSNVEWRNDNFERVDVKTGKLMAGAHPQPMK